MFHATYATTKYQNMTSQPLRLLVNGQTYSNIIGLGIFGEIYT